MSLLKNVEGEVAKIENELKAYIAKQPIHNELLRLETAIREGFDALVGHVEKHVGAQEQSVVAEVKQEEAHVVAEVVSEAKSVEADVAHEAEKVNAAVVADVVSAIEKL